MIQENVYSIATSNTENFHIYKMALSGYRFSYIQKILGNFQHHNEFNNLDYIYYLYISLSFILSISLFFVATFFRITEVSQ
jgi:hypothetical protein